VLAAVVALWPRAAQRPVAPATTAGVGPQADQVVSQGPEPAAVLPTSTRARPDTTGRAVSAGYWDSRGRTLAAWGPLGPDVTSNSTGWPSASER
jgi:hypothetical protein